MQWRATRVPIGGIILHIGAVKMSPVLVPNPLLFSPRVAILARPQTPARSGSIESGSVPLMRSPWIIAHRGASGYTPGERYAPEHSGESRAIRRGIHRNRPASHSRRPLRRHSRRSLGTSIANGRGPLRDHTLAELRALDVGLWYDREFAGQQIPTLEEILAFTRQHDVVFYLEIKQGSAWGMDHALVGALQSAETQPERGDLV